MTNETFEKWLVREVKFRPKSATDTASRLRRAERFIELSRPLKEEDLASKLSRDKEFSKLSIFVKPQLKRAVLLY